MPQSLSSIVVHLVFSTKNRLPLISNEMRDELHRYMAGTLKNHACPPVQVGGVADHVHLLFHLSRTMTMAQVVELVKTSSSKWMKERGTREFSWQGGYAAFSISRSDIGKVEMYVRNQEEHHCKRTFKEELLELLREADLSWDERYLWE